MCLSSAATAIPGCPVHGAFQVGVLAPEAHPTGQLLTGQVGYVIPGIKDVQAARVGDTWHLARQPVQPLPGFKPIKPMVFAGGQWAERGGG